MKLCLYFCVFASFLMLSGCSKDKSNSNDESDSRKKYWTAAVTESYDDGFGGIFYGDSSTASSEEESKNEMFLASGSEEATQEDYEQINNLCTKVCGILAKTSHGKETEALTEYVVNSDLENYLIYEFANLPVKLSENNTMTFSISEFEISNGFAFVSGSYQNNTSSEGPFVFIVENSEGKLVVNDLVCMIMDSADYTYRSEIVNIPKEDYWKNPENYSGIDILE